MKDGVRLLCSLPKLIGINKVMYYKNLEVCSDETINSLWQLINNAKTDDWWRISNKVEWRISISPDIFAKDIQTKTLLDEFVEVDRCYIQRLEPNTCYNWHTDYARDTSLTMCLNVYDKSFTVFGQPAQGYHIRDMHPLYYKKNTMYLIDGTMPHCGMNFSNETRYLVSMSLSIPTTFIKTLVFLKGKFPESYATQIPSQ
jgi:hypothetical protein